MYIFFLIGHWLKCELIWLLTIVVQPQPGFAMNAPKHSELNDPWESIPCKFIRLNWFVTNVPRISGLITRNSSGICKGLTSPKRKRKTECTNVENAPDHLIMRKIWSAIWLNIRKAHSNQATLNNKRNLFAINVERFMAIINHGFIMLRVIASSINAKQ